MNDRCPSCPNLNTCVMPIGPDTAKVMLIGDCPDKDSNRLGIPYVGRLGTELDSHFLPLGGLNRDEVYITYTVKCMPARNDGKLKMDEERDKELARSCANYFLVNEIENVQPEIIVPMGTFSNYVLDDKMLDGHVNLPLHHGMPRESVYGIHFPMWSLAGGISEPKKMLDVRTDWIRLKRYRFGKLPIWTDQHPVTDYKEVTEVSEIRALDPMALMGCDTEFDPDESPVCLTYSVRPGSGRLIQSSRRDLLEAFQSKLETWQNLIIFHHWMADKPIVKKMGLTFPDRLIRDSMIRAHLLGNLPKGLKALAYRELGMGMTDFEDVVFPFSAPRILDYYSAMKDFDWPKPPVEMVRDSKTGKWKKYAAQGMNTKIKRFFTDLAKNSDKDIIKSWDNWKDNHELIQEKMGKFYALDIRDVPMPELLQYACRDADATLRVWPILEAMVDNMPGKPQENWRKAA